MPHLPHLVLLNRTSSFSLLVQFVWAGENAAMALRYGPPNRPNCKKNCAFLDKTSCRSQLRISLWDECLLTVCSLDGRLQTNLGL